jgi:hypothetical protein
VRRQDMRVANDCLGNRVRTELALYSLSRWVIKG